MGCLGEMLEMLGFTLLRQALRLCCFTDGTIDAFERRHRGGARLTVYLDGMPDELVRRQLEFRKEHKLKRSASRSSISSLGSVSEESAVTLMLPRATVPVLRRNMSTPADMSSLHGAPRMRSSSSDERLTLLERQTTR